MFPPVIKALVIINVAIFLLEIFILRFYTIDSISIDRIFNYYLALSPIETGRFYIWQLISYQFIHDTGGIVHIFFNLFALWMFGVELEHLWGSKKFTLFYILSGIGAGLTQMIFSSITGSSASTIGASGAVYGILLGFGMTFPDRPIFMFPFFIPIPAKFFVLIYIGLALLMGMTSDGNVAHFAHLGGAATGFLLFKFGDKVGLFAFFNNLFKRKQVLVNPMDRPNVHGIWEAKSAPKTYNPQPENYKFNVEGENISQDVIDSILDKISASGYQNLTDKEKKILFEISKKLK
jgi:membrane associated rhomboid family serine protease